MGNEGKKIQKDHSLCRPWNELDAEHRNNLGFSEEEKQLNLPPKVEGQEDMT